jgi:glycosyltransferase involved in cell wall biosynthesis
MVGLASGTVRVIHNGVADLPITPLARPVPGPIVGSVGRLAPEKGYDVLLHALQALPDVTAVLVGDGPDRERLERLTHELGLESRLIMPGWQTDPRPWLPTFDVFVLPSRLEALPLAIIEAMLASRPVVASRVGGVPEVVLDERTGLLVRPADPDSLAGALRRLLESPDRREHMGRAGRRLARQEFSAGRMVRSFESLYEELVGPTAEPGRSR